VLEDIESLSSVAALERVIDYESLLKMSRVFLPRCFKAGEVFIIYNA
jgi:hypothetical protein